MGQPKPAAALPARRLPGDDRLRAPRRPVLEAASLREYGASFSGTEAFAEALAGQVAYDVLAATGADWVEVTFLQNVRGGWQIEALQRLPSGQPAPKQPR